MGRLLSCGNLEDEHAYAVQHYTRRTVINTMSLKAADLSQAERSPNGAWVDRNWQESLVFVAMPYGEQE